MLQGGDMTAEAALTKLSYLLGKGLPTQRIKELMVKNLCGEMTVLDIEQKQLRDSDLLTSIAEAMNLSSSSVRTAACVSLTLREQVLASVSTVVGADSVTCAGHLWVCRSIPIGNWQCKGKYKQLSISVV